MLGTGIDAPKIEQHYAGMAHADWARPLLVAESAAVRS